MFKFLMLFGGNQFLSFIYATNLFLIKLFFSHKNFQINGLQKTTCSSSDTYATKSDSITT